MIGRNGLISGGVINCKCVVIDWVSESLIIYSCRVWVGVSGSEISYSLIEEVIV